jgi:hypothetical protein
LLSLIFAFMKKPGIFILFPAGLACLALFCSWGFFGHRSINRLAVFTLPDPLMGFYKRHIDYLIRHAADADKRRYVSEEEARRHYLDADRYEQALPFDTIPEKWEEAVETFSEDTLIAYGIAPWHLEKMVRRLTLAFERKDLAQILRLSADIGHYAGDCHVPLHSTMNYNGQLSGQKGIHGLWESRLPELFADNYDFFVGKAAYTGNVLRAVWEAFGASVAARDSVLLFEKELDLVFDPGKKYSFEDRGQTTVKVYSYEYSEAFHESLNGMVERRMRAAVLFTGSLWYTAWVNAGSPDPELFFRQSEPALPEPVFIENRKMIGREEAE